VNVLGRASDSVVSSLGHGFPDPESTKRSFARHQGKANVVFCDGHVESPTLQFLFEDTSDDALVRWNRDHLPHREKLSP
jgi:prepilin-type processing-associated H-X9-DG protein